MGAKKQQKGLEKSIQKKKQKIAEDLTFGMKNKKSKKSQTIIKQVSSRVPQTDMSASEAKKLKKLQEKQRQRELRAIFGEPERKKEEHEKKDDEKTAHEVLEEVDFELEEESEMTLEDVIEKERAKIYGGTLVSEETFKRWKQFKLEQKEKQREVEQKLKEKAFKKGGATGLSGRELFEMDSKLFQDDEGAVGKDELHIDEDLFLDSDEDEEDGVEKEPELEEWDPATWKESDPPKQKLQEFITKVLKLKNDSYPQYEEVQIQSGGFLFKVFLPHLQKHIQPMVPHQSKKNAQNAAAYTALKFLESQSS